MSLASAIKVFWLLAALNGAVGFVVAHLWIGVLARKRGVSVSPLSQGTASLAVGAYWFALGVSCAAVLGPGRYELLRRLSEMWAVKLLAASPAILLMLPLVRWLRLIMLGIGRGAPRVRVESRTRGECEPRVVGMVTAEAPQTPHAEGDDLEAAWAEIDRALREVARQRVGA